MGSLDQLAHGFSVALTPENLLWALLGVTLGTVVGVLPGIGPALTVALLLPVTYDLEPVSAFIMFAGIYYGGMYGGSTTSILLNTPGESASIMTALEGNQMARRGRGAAALATAAIGSFVAGTLATLALTLVAPTMVEIALKFGEAEYVALIILAFVAVTALLGRSAVRGMVSLSSAWLLGWWVSTVSPHKAGLHSAFRNFSTASMWLSWPSGSLPSVKHCGLPLGYGTI
ncbi:MAG: tripartite tricarboxylate transporter permease [Thermomicrobiales bacterium]